jgi:hypothetical protein
MTVTIISTMAAAAINTADTLPTTSITLAATTAVDSATTAATTSPLLHCTRLMLWLR